MRDDDDANMLMAYAWGKEDGRHELKKLKAENERLREALHRIAHSPNGPKVYCRDGHEEAVLIARAALGEEK
jgi:hypothetical protein